MLLQPLQTAYAIFHLKMGDMGLLTNVAAQTVRNGVGVPGITTTVSTDALGRIVVSFQVPANAAEGDVFHVTLTADYNGKTLEPHTIEAGKVLPDSMTADGIADAVWNAATEDYEAPGSFGRHVSKALLTFCRWLGLR